MDEITIAIISALAAGAKKIGEKTVVEGYDALKKLLKKKFGEKSDVAEATAKLEERPESEARQKMLAEEVDTVKADKDPEILEAARNLTSTIEAQPGGAEIIQNITIGNKGVFVKGNGSNIITGNGNTIGSA